METKACNTLYGNRMEEISSGNYPAAFFLGRYLSSNIINGGINIKVEHIHPKRVTLIRRPKYLIGVYDPNESIIIPKTIEIVVKIIGLPVSLIVSLISVM